MPSMPMRERCFMCHMTVILSTRLQTRFLELENHQFSVYLGNYDYFIQKKTERMAQEKSSTRRKAW